MKTTLKYLASFFASFIVTLIVGYFFFDEGLDFSGAFTVALFSGIALYAASSLEKTKKESHSKAHDNR